MSMKYVSILGDSVSTFEGFNPEGYEVFYEGTSIRNNGLRDYRDTWWAQVIDGIDGVLCANASYSGSRVTGNVFPAATSEERITALKCNEVTPDLILIYIGYNDWGNGIRVKRSGMFERKGMLVFADAYRYMIKRIKEKYPRAVIVCGSLMQTKVKGKNNWSFPKKYAGVDFDDYNSAIKAICKKEKCKLADLNSLNIRYETLDGSHPTIEGHRTLAEAWLKFLV